MPTILISRINTAAIVGTTFTVVERMFMASPVRKVSKPAVPRLPTLPTLFPPGNDALLALVRLNLPHAPKAIQRVTFPRLQPSRSRVPAAAAIVSGMWGIVLRAK